MKHRDLKDEKGDRKIFLVKKPLLMPTLKIIEKKNMYNKIVI